MGSRTPGPDAEKAVQVDVITRDQIAASGYRETAQVIESLTPSFNFPSPTITDGTDTVRPATLRGLGPDQVPDRRSASRTPSSGTRRARTRSFLNQILQPAARESA